jgi:type IV pilus assembly protein PilA
MKKLEERKLNNNGFSLVELIIVIAIMAVLVGVLSPQFIKYVEQSRRSTDIQNAENIRTAILADIADGTLSGTVTNIEFTGTRSGTAGSYTALGASTIAASEAPTVQGSVVNNGGHLYVSFNATDGTCEVFADSAGKYSLTTSKGATNYKNGHETTYTEVASSSS